MDRNKIASRIATRVVTSYMVLKVPVGYSLIKNTKELLQKQVGTRVSDEDLEEIFARFLDLVIFGLMRDVENVGSAMPDSKAFSDVAKEILQNSESDEDDDVDFGDFQFADDDQEDDERF